MSRSLGNAWLYRKGKVFYGQYATRMWGQLSNTCSNLLKNKVIFQTPSWSRPQPPTDNDVTDAITLSGSIRKVVASYAEDCKAARSIPCCGLG